MQRLNSGMPSWPVGCRDVESIRKFERRRLSTEYIYSHYRQTSEWPVQRRDGSGELMGPRYEMRNGFAVLSMVSWCVECSDNLCTD
jgi:hypothetical protein